jgi:hypothetical protein
MVALRNLVAVHEDLGCRGGSLGLRAVRHGSYRYWVRTLEEITYEAGRSALADQESLVAGIRQRTGTLLAAHALVASFLGATTVRAQGLHAWGWVALAALVLGLVAAAILLAPWKLKFAVDARELYDELYEQAAGGHPRLVGGSGLWIPGPAQEERGDGAAHVAVVGRARLCAGAGVLGHGAVLERPE